MWCTTRWARPHSRRAWAYCGPAACWRCLAAPAAPCRPSIPCCSARRARSSSPGRHWATTSPAARNCWPAPNPFSAWSRMANSSCASSAPTAWKTRSKPTATCKPARRPGSCCSRRDPRLRAPARRFRPAVVAARRSDTELLVLPASRRHRRLAAFERQLALSEQRRVARNLCVPQVMREPVEIRLQHGAVAARLGDAVSEAGVEDEPRVHVLVLQAAVEFEAVRHGHALVVRALLDQRRRLGLLDGRHRRRL